MATTNGAPAVPNYASLKISPEARDALQRSALNMSASVGRRITMSDALLTLATVANRHPEELRAALTATGQEGTPEHD